jgi:uncharacterized membrane protein
VRGHPDLRRIAALALLCALLAPLLPVGWLSLLFALPLALFLPGYGLTLAIFARRPIERPQAMLLGLGLSLSVLALGALPLNYVPRGIGPVSWAILLLLVTLCGCGAAAWRRPRGATARPPRWPSRPDSNVGALGLLGAALACTALAFVLTFNTTSAERADGYTALWLLPPTPRDAAAGGTRVGVNSEEQKRTAYRLRVRVGERPAEIVRRFSLDPGETRVLKLTPQSPPPGAAIPVRAKLFLQDKPGDVYRRVSGWLAEPTQSR